MTEEQKELLIAKMLDAPSSLSDEELDAILHDPELTDILEVSAAVGGACMRRPEPDVDAEWERFSRNIRRKPFPMRRIMRIAAVVAGAALLTAAMLTLFNGVAPGSETTVFASVEQPDETEKPIGAGQQTLIAEAKGETDSPATMTEINAVESMRQPAGAEVAEPHTATGAGKGAEDIDIDEYLRIQQARIENDLALQAADEYEERISGQMALLDFYGADREALDVAILTVTMQ